MKYAISYLLGGLVLFPLLLYGVNIFFFSPREVTYKQVDQYIKDSIIILDNADNKNIDIEKYIKDKQLGLHAKSITHFLAQRGSGKQEYFQYIYYSSNYEKYFSLLVFYEGGGVIRAAYGRSKIEITVNKIQWEDPDYGTKENPIPVLKFVGVNRSLRSNNLDYNKQYMDKVYHETVQMYLTYLMPKSEFKQTFKKD